MLKIVYFKKNYSYTKALRCTVSVYSIEETCHVYALYIGHKYVEPLSARGIAELWVVKLIPGHGYTDRLRWQPVKTMGMTQPSVEPGCPQNVEPHQNGVRFSCCSSTDFSGGTSGTGLIFVHAVLIP